MLIWTPDFCPPGPPCRLEIERDWSAVRQFLTICAHHKSLGLTGQQIFRALLQSTRLKERARWEIKLSLGLNKQHPGVPYRVNPDGSFTILTDRASLAWRLDDGSAGPLPRVSDADRTAARTVALAAIASIERPLGTSTLTVL